MQCKQILWQIQIITNKKLCKIQSPFFLNKLVTQYNHHHHQACGQKATVLLIDNNNNKQCDKWKWATHQTDKLPNANKNRRRKTEKVKKHGVYSFFQNNIYDKYWLI